MGGHVVKTENDNEPDAIETFDQQSVVSLELQMLANKTGSLTAAAVVDAAKPKTSALHNHFEWKNTVAAEKYREEQARQLIRRVHIVNSKTDDDGTTRIVKVRALIHSAQRDAYVPMATVVLDPKLREEFIERLNVNLRGVAKQLREFNMYSSVVTAIDGALSV